MVIKRSPGEPCRWRAVNFEIHLWISGMNADCIWRSICIQHVQIEAGLNSDPGNDSFWDKSVTLSMFIDLLTSTWCRSTQVKIASTDLWPQEMFTFSEMLALVESESSFGAYVCHHGHRRPGGSLATSDLVGVCVCVCVCVIVAQWWAEQMLSVGSLWEDFLSVDLTYFKQIYLLLLLLDVGLWVAVCFPAKISLHRSTCKTTFARLTQSQAISQSFRVFISFRSMRDTTFFFIFRNSFLYKITVSFTMVIKRSPGGPCRWRAVNFEIHLWSSGMNADCIWRSICIQHVQIEADLNSDPGNDSFWDKSVTLSMLIDLLTSTCRSTQVKIASTDLWPQGVFTFSEMLALVESESSFGAYVCHRRPGGSLATSDLVW